MSVTNNQSYLSNNGQNQSQHNTNRAQNNGVSPSMDPVVDVYEVNQVGSNLGASVVPDLMRVYESLTQSSTLQQPSSVASLASASMSGQFMAPSNSFQDQYTQQQYGQYTNQNHQHQQQQFQPSQQHHKQHQSRHIYVPNHQNSQQHHGYGKEVNTSHQLNHNQSGQHQLRYQGMEKENGIQSDAGQQYPAHDPISYQENSAQQQQHQKPHSNVFNGGQQSSNNYNIADSRLSSSRKRGSDQSFCSLDSNEKPKTRKKAGHSDDRWSKRFTWPDDLHREFVAAIFEVGLKHSSPSAIMEHMQPHEQITSERIKSHLQKYRLHKDKSKRQFIANYDSSLVNLKAARTSISNPIDNKGNSHSTNQPGQVSSSSRHHQSLSFGELAAHVTLCTTTEEATEPSSMNQNSPKEANCIIPSSKSGALFLPRLSELEKKSALGASLGYVMGLFFSLKQQLMLQRLSGNVSAETTASCFPHDTSSSNNMHIMSSPDQSSLNPVIGHRNANVKQFPARNEGAAVGTNRESFMSPPQKNADGRPSSQLQIQIPPSNHEYYTPKTEQFVTVQPTQQTSWLNIESADKTQGKQKDDVSSSSSKRTALPLRSMPIERENPQAQPGEILQVQENEGIALECHTSKPLSEGTNKEETKKSISLTQSSSSTTRNNLNLEQSHKMKLEMKTQMVFQNKMRALKQQELNKCKVTNHSAESQQQAQHNVSFSSEKQDVDFVVPLSVEVTNSGKMDAITKESSPVEMTEGQHKKGESPVESSVLIQGSVHLTAEPGASDEFWNTDMVDDQLFEFLLNE